MNDKEFKYGESKNFPEECDECGNSCYVYYTDNLGYCYCLDCKKELFR